MLGQIRIKTEEFLVVPPGAALGARNAQNLTLHLVHTEARGFTLRMKALHMFV